MTLSPTTQNVTHNSLAEKPVYAAIAHPPGADLSCRNVRRIDVIQSGFAAMDAAIPDEPNAGRDSRCVTMMPPCRRQRRCSPTIHLPSPEVSDFGAGTGEELTLRAYREKRQISRSGGSRAGYPPDLRLPAVPPAERWIIE